MSKIIFFVWTCESVVTFKCKTDGRSVQNCCFYLMESFLFLSQHMISDRWHCNYPFPRHPIVSSRLKVWETSSVSRVNIYRTELLFSNSLVYIKDDTVLLPELRKLDVIHISSNWGPSENWDRVYRMSRCSVVLYQIQYDNNRTTFSVVLHHEFFFNNYQVPTGPTYLTLFPSSTKYRLVYHNTVYPKDSNFNKD